MKRRRELLADDHKIILDGLKRILETHQPKTLAPDVIERIEEKLSAAEAREKN